MPHAYEQPHFDAAVAAGPRTRHGAGAGRQVRDLDSHRLSRWSASVAAYEKSLLKGTARLRVTREGMARLAKLGAASVEQAAIAPADADRWQEVTLPVETFDFAAEQLLAMGPNVEVLAPPELRERLRELAGRVVALNG